ncbi:hypothetical protein TNCV_3500411 [Trichonephila clavipes]|nr:hypothetical protein TNCV_3500411 [Trichonephila clavipes]
MGYQTTPLRVKGDIEDVSSELDNGGSKVVLWDEMLRYPSLLQVRSLEYLFALGALDKYKKKFREPFRIARGQVLIFMEETGGQNCIAIIYSTYKMPHFKVIPTPEECIGYAKACVMDCRIEKIIDSVWRRTRNLRFYEAGTLPLRNSSQKKLLFIYNALPLFLNTGTIGGY